MNEQINYKQALGTLVTVFFFWGFIAASNSVFIPFCKTFFQIDQFQSQLVDFAFYGAYYIGALLLFIVSGYVKTDILNKWGFKNGIIYGLILSAIGAAVMIPAISSGSFSFILASLFVVALGFSLQQTSANPFAIALGEPATGSHRLNLAGGVNSFGTAIGPIVVAFALFGAATYSDDQIASINLSTVKTLYVVVGGLFLLAAALFIFSKKLPQAKGDADFVQAPKAVKMLAFITLVLLVIFYFVFDQYRGDIVDSNLIFQLMILALFLIVGGLLYSNQKAIKNPDGWGAMQYPQLVLGMLAIFTYVGVEVTILSN